MARRKPVPATEGEPAVVETVAAVPPVPVGKQIVFIVTTSVSQKEASTFKGLTSGILGAPAENAVDQRRLDEKIEVKSALKLSEVVMDPEPDLVVLDLDTLVGDYPDQAAAVRALRRVLKVRFMKAKVVATFIRLPNGPLLKVGFKALIDRKKTDSGEALAREGCAVLPEAMTRYKKYMEA